ncbi:N-acetylglucosamine-6-phosphate deacetylase [Pedobacter nyackensis]|uniref:N-acetylglucosamine-6-phosphate deacetylase n=1 Tax=Pedobacter nyackensis TaxID=475255 RepID=A0A1W2EXL0_9SPHI|nr:N-acetylglucosamine-6-phosphate deacetylase [Pedobacter nyackensis]SMD14439.1 N-acetylglucosamine-6-phosphate deacetylase [Pedobacter nyackensis]
MSDKKIKIYNGNIITPYRIIKNGTVVIANGLITGVMEGNAEVADAIEIDAKGKYIAPGFIDMHIHGGGGYDFMDGNVNSFLKIAETHVKYGTTAMCPTTLTSELSNLLETLEHYEQANKLNTTGSQFLGMHLEGPYFSKNQSGAQDPRFMRDPDPIEYKKVLYHSHAIRRWSAAPELKGALEFGRYLKSLGVIAAIAHTDAIYEEVLEAFESGYTLATHFYSAMSGVSRRNAFRYAGAIEAGYLIDEMDVEIIADGIHLPPPLLKLVYKIKGASRTALITDAMRATGMPPGKSILGNIHDGLEVIVEDGVAKLMDRSAFAGSVATADRLVRTMIKDADVPMMEAIQMITSTPARILGVSNTKGSIVEGKDADLVLFDSDINISMTIIQGVVVYNADNELQKNSLEITV